MRRCAALVVIVLLSSGLGRGGPSRARAQSSSEGPVRAGAQSSSAGQPAQTQHAESASPAPGGSPAEPAPSAPVPQRAPAPPAPAPQRESVLQAAPSAQEPQRESALQAAPSAQEPQRESVLQAAEAAPEPRFSWLPGDARVISHASSASRDTALLDGILYPRISVTLGTEFGLLRYRAGPVSFRPGVFALFNLESRTKAEHFFPAPGGDSDLWRGILGYQVSTAFDHFARRALGDAGALEFVVGYFHESEHHSAGNNRPEPGDGPDHPELRGLPQLNNWVMFDLGARGAWAKIEVVARVQGKVFTNGEPTRHEPFRGGIGGDLIVRARHLSWLQPFWANFWEVLASPVREDASTFRSLLGVAFPGVFGEFSVYLSLTSGAGKGLLIPVSETDFGGGLRYSPFRP